MWGLSSGSWRKLSLLAVLSGVVTLLGTVSYVASKIIMTSLIEASNWKYEKIAVTAPWVIFIAIILIVFRVFATYFNWPSLSPYKGDKKFALLSIFILFIVSSISYVIIIRVVGNIFSIDSVYLFSGWVYFTCIVVSLSVILMLTAER